MIRKPIRHTVNTTLQNLNIEVDQQSNLAARRLRVRELLSLMNRCNALNSLNLHDHCSLYEKINAVAAI